MQKESYNKSNYRFLEKKTEIFEPNDEKEKDEVVGHQFRMIVLKKISASFEIFVQSPPLNNIFCREKQSLKEY